MSAGGIQIQNSRGPWAKRGHRGEKPTNLARHQPADVPSRVVASAVIRAGQWRKLAPELDAYGLDLIIERDGDRVRCLAVVTSAALATLSRTDGPNYEDPFWVTLGYLGA